MGLQVSLSFSGSGREALEFYRSIFNFAMPQLFTYAQMPDDPTRQTHEFKYIEK